MSDLQAPASTASARLLLLTSLLTGTLDISAAVLNFYAKGGREPTRIFRFIASAIVGPEAFLGGSGYAALGVFLHYLIAAAFTCAFLLLYCRVGLLRGPWALTGTLYGLLIWAIMNLLVVPLSNVASWKVTFASAIWGALFLIACIGLPTAYLAERFLSSRRKQPAV